MTNFILLNVKEKKIISIMKNSQIKLTYEIKPLTNIIKLILFTVIRRIFFFLQLPIVQ